MDKVQFYSNWLKMQTAKTRGTKNIIKKM
jgi:hypothetical protein